MKVTARGRCALKAMVELALHADKRLSVKEIAKNQELSVRYLEQIFSSLKKSKLIMGTKGPSGGYTLEKPADKISVGEILFTVEGRSSFKVEESKDILETCLDEMIWEKLDSHIEGFLFEMTLSDIVNTFESKSHDYMYYI